jgi:hypothetical protein
MVASEFFVIPAATHALEPPVLVVPPVAFDPPVLVVPPTAFAPPVVVVPPTAFEPPELALPPEAVVPPAVGAVVVLLEVTEPPLALLPPVPGLPPGVRELELCDEPPFAVVDVWFVEAPPDAFDEIAVFPPTDVDEFPLSLEPLQPTEKTIAITP